MKEYHQKPEVRQKKREYQNIPEIKEKLKEYWKKYHKLPEVKRKHMDYYYKNKDMISEINFIEMGKEIHAVPQHIGNVMENATKFYDGVIIQNVIGSFMASIFPSSGMHYQIQCPEFKGYQIIDAKYKNNVLIVIASKKGKYDKFILKFDNKFSSYSLRKVEDISYIGINFTVLDNGVVIHINENEELEIFSNKKDSSTLKVISNDAISGDMKLFNDGVQVIFAKNKKLYKLKMR